MFRFERPKSSEIDRSAGICNTNQYIFSYMVIMILPAGFQIGPKTDNNRNLKMGD